ncbi:hypothetical protein AALP_AAs42697U000600 [Arabis alpina]|uniref:Hyaluronan/mRNA-binding protein domain-containing protein n=1 Tax=Arabis alpina TaxID=50452 RepID=A0A087G2E3_ARAAL|nr:hypothetical protein AALP_AAs42697U000600 [Arabis alpina]
MASFNPFDLLDGDAEDPIQLLAAKTKKVEKVVAAVNPKPTKPTPTSKAVRESRNGPGAGRGSGFSNGSGGRYNNRDSRNRDGPRNENGYGGGYRSSREGDGARRDGSVGGYRGGDRRGGSNNGESGDFERPRRTYDRHSGESGDFERPRRSYDRHSGTGHGNEDKREGGGRGNWGIIKDDVAPVTEESKTVAVEKQGSKGEAADAKKESPAKEQAKSEPEPEPVEFTLEEYEKIMEEKKKALEVTKVEERKVDTKVFDSMQQLSNKRSNNDEVFIKLGTEKDKRLVEKEEKAKKSLSINEFLKPVNGKSFYRGGYQREQRGGRGGREPREGGREQREGGRGGRGQREGGRGGRGQREGAAPVGGNQRFEKAPAPAPVPAPAIEDEAHFPTLGK